MRIRPDEVAAIIQQQIAAFGETLEAKSVGTVLQVGDGVARVYGVTDCMAGELLQFPGGVMGLALNLEEDSVACLLLGEGVEIKEGDPVHTTGRIIQVPVGEALLGRVVNALGQPIDGKRPLAAERTRPIETIAPNVIERQPVCEPLQTGLKAIDSMIPIGRGQRELIIGDRQTGKTAIAVDTIINQRDTDVACIYVAVGQKASTVARLVHILEQHDAMRYTTVVAANASDPATMQYIAPYAGCSMGEDFRDRGKHAVVVYDDLTKHAQAYRQVSLLLRRPPGREAYPGDIFYLHGHLLERAAKLSDEKGGGSLTALPIVETQLGDYSSYIPTNIISITDGQIRLEADLFFAGVRPAIDIGNSVSRVGGDARISAMNRVAGRLRLDLAYYRELAAFAQFSSELDKATRDTLDRGARMVELLKQPQYAPMPVEEQVAVLFAGVEGFVDDLPTESLRRFEQGLREHLRESHPAIYRRIRETTRLDDEVADNLREAIAEFKQTFAKESEQ